MIVMCRFRGAALEFAAKRSLVLSQSEADQTVRGFAEAALTRDLPMRVAVHAHAQATPRLERFCATVEAVSQGRGVPCWRVTEGELLSGLGEPPIRGRGELRRLARILWPMLSYYPSMAPASLDAASLGIYVQATSVLQAAETEGALDAAA